MKEEHCPSELHERLEFVESNYEKIMQIIEIERSNEIKLKQKITELEFSQVNRRERRKQKRGGRKGGRGEGKGGGERRGGGGVEEKEEGKNKERGSKR